MGRTKFIGLSAAILVLVPVLASCSDGTKEAIEATYGHLEDHGISSSNVIEENILPDASGVWVKFKAETDDDVCFVQIEDRDGELTIVGADDMMLSEPIVVKDGAGDEIADACACEG